MKEALERLRIGLPYLMHSVEEAAKAGTAGLAIVVTKEDGSGMILSTINDPKALFTDIAKVAGLPEELTAEQRAECEGVAFIQRQGIGASH